MASQSLAYKGLVVVLNCGAKLGLHDIDEPLGTTGIHREPAAWSQPRLSPQHLALSQIVIYFKKEYYHAITKCGRLSKIPYGSSSHLSHFCQIPPSRLRFLQNRYAEEGNTDGSADH